MVRLPALILGMRSPLLLLCGRPVAPPFAIFEGWGSNSAWIGPYAAFASCVRIIFMNSRMAAMWPGERVSLQAS
jgi:hypothetical protein